MEVIKLYELGKKAKNGDNDAMLEILKLKRGILNCKDDKCRGSTLLIHKNPSKIHR